MVKAKKQIAALPWRRRKGHIDVLLITSRETKRWVIPKGWPMDHLIDSNAARQEAYEEAGIGGRVQRVALGHFSYDKRLADGSALPVRADVYGLEVGIEHKSWPEKKQRTRQWFSVEEAAGRVDEPGLKKIIRSLA